VTTLGFDEKTAKALEAVYATRDVRRRRALVHEALAAAPGERVLDVGCGPGFYVAELLERVGPEGSVAGVDLSQPMLALAAHRAGAGANVELKEGGATALPFEDESFDAAVSVQVLEYVADVDLAIAEIHRVLRPGGRVVIWDVDWQTVSMHSSDPERLERVLRAWDRHLVHPSLPRTLPASLRRAGFSDVALAGHSFTTAEFTPEAYGGSLVGVVENYLTALEDFPDADAAGWAEDQRALGEAGEFYFSCVQCCVSATRA
jgi:ubiquinone/menaquinone biosynthesis C-methylase UbiE